MRVMKIKDVIELSERYGNNTTLAELARKIQGKKIHKCPKCGGSGTITKEVNVAEYWECCERLVYRTFECDLCKGEGYTEKEYKPRMVQDGWEEK